MKWGFILTVHLRTKDRFKFLLSFTFLCQQPTKLPALNKSSFLKNVLKKKSKKPSDNGMFKCAPTSGISISTSWTLYLGHLKWDTLNWTLKDKIIMLAKNFQLAYMFLSINYFSFKVKTTKQTHQCWIKVETTLIVNVHQRCFNFDIWLKMNIEPTYIYRRCFNVGKTTLKQRL